MNTNDTNEATRTADLPTDRRPLGFWLRTVDGLITREFRAAFAGRDVTRRDWMLLNLIDRSAESPALADRIGRRSKRIAALIERGWVTADENGCTLTDAGRAALQQLGELVGTVRAKVAGAVSPEDFATTMASLEAIARELGWDETQHSHRPGRRFGHPGFAGRRGFGPRHGFGPRDGFGPRERGERRGLEAGDPRGVRNAERAYERGFDAGFARGRDLQA